MSKNIVPIVAALFTRQVSGQIGFKLEVALFKRKQGDTAAGYWEFPGGKKENGESDEEALVREIQEELNLDVQVLRLAGESQLLTNLQSQSRVLDLKLYLVRSEHLCWTLNDHDDVCWVDELSWRDLQVAPLDIPLLEAIFLNSDAYLF